MDIAKLWSWFSGSKQNRATRRVAKNRCLSPRLTRLEDRTVPAGYLAVGAGFGAPPLVAIRVDIVDALAGQPPNPAGQPAAPRSDGKTDLTTQIFHAYNPAFRGGVNTAAGNFDGNVTTPDQLVTAAGTFGGPHVILWDMIEAADGKITVAGKRAEFLAYDSRFNGGVNVATGDLDGDGRAELITAPMGRGGPHVKIWKFDISENKFVMVNEFMAFETTFTGGVNIASGQGYQAPYQIRQVLDAQLPDAPVFGSNFATVPYFPPSSRPGFAQGIPLVSGPFFLGIGSNTPDPANPGLNLPYFSVGGATYQFGGANLLNSIGNVMYSPNVIDPLGQNNVPPEQPLVMATWADGDANQPAFAIPDLNYGPFVQIGETIDGEPIVTRLTAASGQPNARNQLVVGPGVGGGPIVRVYDFTNTQAGFQRNAMIEFNAFADDPVLANSRTGLKVAIGNVVDNPVAMANGTIVPNVRSPELGDEGITFPISTNFFRQGTAQIVVAQANGSLARIFADYNFIPGGSPGAQPARRTSITQLDMRPVMIGSETVFDPNNPLGGYQSVVNFNTFRLGIDPQFVGPLFTAVSHLDMEFTLNADGTFTAGNIRGANIFGAGNVTSGPSRGPKVRIFDRMGPNVVFDISNGTNPDALFTPQGTPIFPGEPTPYLNPIDDFSAFLSGIEASLGIGGVAFGFGVLPPPQTVVTELPPINVTSVSNPILV
jgi:hypothetical protein